MTTALDRISASLNSLESLVDNYRHDGIDIDDIETQVVDLAGSLRPLLPLLKEWEAAVSAHAHGKGAAGLKASRLRAERALLAALRGTGDKP